MIFQAKGFDHADAGQTLLRLIVQAGERRLRYFEALMQARAVFLDHQRHNRHRNQRQQRQLPADLHAHYRQHDQPHHQRIHQRQHPFTRGKHHAIDIVGRARDQIAGTVAQVKRRMLAAKLAVKSSRSSTASW